jgi:hypothetical protein
MINDEIRAEIERLSQENEALRAFLYERADKNRPAAIEMAQLQAQIDELRSINNHLRYRLERSEQKIQRDRRFLAALAHIIGESMMRQIAYNIEHEE